MKKLVVGLVAVGVLLAGSVLPSDAGGGWHHHGWHGGWGWRGPVFWGPRVVIGAPFVFAPPVYYPRPYVYAAPVYAPPALYAAPAPVVAPQPPVYTQGGQYWYYCQDPAGYYPTIAQCPAGWLQVSPRSQ